MKVLSIFVDESGDVGDYQSISPYYIFSMVFHNQEDDISSEIEKLNHDLSLIGFGDMAIHTEPLIRREEAYANLWL